MPKKIMGAEKFHNYIIYYADSLRHYWTANTIYILIYSSSLYSSLILYAHAHTRIYYYYYIIALFFFAFFFFYYYAYILLLLYCFILLRFLLLLYYTHETCTRIYYYYYIIALFFFAFFFAFFFSYYYIIFHIILISEPVHHATKVKPKPAIKDYILNIFIQLFYYLAYSF